MKRVDTTKRRRRVIWSERWQLILWVLGISWHNKYRGECTPDFSCCCKACKLPLWKRLNQIGIYWR